MSTQTATPDMSPSVRVWTKVPATPKDLRNKGILNRYYLVDGLGTRFGSILESGGSHQDSKPAACVRKNGKPVTSSHDSIAAAKIWVEFNASEVFV